MYTPRFYTFCIYVIPNSTTLSKSILILHLYILYILLHFYAFLILRNFCWNATNLDSIYIYISIYPYNFYAFYVCTFSHGTSPSPPSVLRYPPTPPWYFFGFKWLYGARCVLRLLFYHGGVQRVTAGRFCVNFGYFTTAAAVNVAAACFWRV